jgi:hypothetical protein
LQALVDDDADIDVYGYGNTDDNGNGFGTLRFAVFYADGLGANHLHLDQHDDEGTHPGDSGSAYLTPSRGSAGYSTDYAIAAVHECSPLNAAGDEEYKGVRADQIAAWFDAQLDVAWDQFDTPSQIMASVSILF